MIYLTSDLHLGHRNIIDYCQRNFRDVHEMNSVLLENILDTVKKYDTLYILGDFAFDKKTFDAYANAISSHCHDVRFIRGNHDAKFTPWAQLLADDFKYNHQHFYLCHYPWQTWRPNTVMLHGHCHGATLTPPADKRLRHRFDVGVDTWWKGRQFFPVSIDQIVERMSWES